MYRIQFFIAGDELSKKMLRTIDGVTKLLTERFGQRIMLSSRDFIAYVLTTNIIQGAADAIQLDVYFVLEAYREELKAKFGVADFPAAMLDGQAYAGEEALKIASRLHSLLEKSREVSVDELISGLKGLSVQEPVTESGMAAMEPAPSPAEDKVLFEGNVIRAGISDCLAKLERLREEGKIDENTYRKMREIYSELLG
jgi:hypothetical protein